MCRNQSFVSNSITSCFYFRSDIKSSCQTDSRICVSHYSANHLFQCAGAYFALVGGYCKEKDLVLLYDASGNKIPPFWIPLTVLFQSIQSKSMDDKNIKGLFLQNNTPEPSRFERVKFFCF